jgi:hypothetical protein
MSEQANEADLVAGAVDVHEWGPSEADEEAVLAALYGPPDADGIYRGTKEAEEE